MSPMLASFSALEGAKLKPGGCAVARLRTAPRGCPQKAPLAATSSHLRARGFAGVSLHSPARRVACSASNESVDEYQNDDFFYETQHALARVLTARAVQKVLIRLHRRSTPTYEWLTSFTKAVPPISGDEFLLQLMKSRAVTHTDETTKLSTTIHPAALAQEVIAVREDLSASVTKGLPEFVKTSNLKVLKRHLEQSHYTLSVTKQKHGKSSNNKSEKKKSSA